jgi:hypothetical protein
MQIRDFAKNKFRKKGTEMQAKVIFFLVCTLVTMQSSYAKPVAPSPAPSMVSPSPVPNMVSPSPMPSMVSASPVPSLVSPSPVPNLVSPSPVPVMVAAASGK